MAGEIAEKWNVLNKAEEWFQWIGKALDGFASSIFNKSLLSTLKINVSEIVKTGADNMEWANFENYRSICDELNKMKDLSWKNLFMEIVKGKVLTKLLPYADLNAAAKNYTEASINNNPERDMVVAQIHALVEPLVMLLNNWYKWYKLRMDGSSYKLIEPSIDNGALWSYRTDWIAFNRFDNNPNSNLSQWVDTQVIQNTAKIINENPNITDLTQLPQAV